MACCGGKCHGPEFDADREGVCSSDLDRFGGDDITCPECGEDVYHDAAICSSCGHAMTDASISKGMPAWVPMVAAGTAAALIGVVLMAM